MENAIDETKIICNGFLKYQTHKHTYKIGDYNNSVRVTTYFRTALKLCASILSMNRGDLRFRIDSERQIFEKLFHGNFI